MAADGGGGWISALARRAEDWREEAEETGRDRGRRWARDAGEARDEAWRRGGEALSDLRRHGSDTRSELRRLWSQLEDLMEREVAPRASSYARTARGVAGEGRERVEEAADYLRDATRARPLLAIGIAVAATWLAVSLIGRGRR
jgi:hypothetical protein